MSTTQVRLTAAERCLIHRQRADRTQLEEAARRGVSLWVYRRMEKGLLLHDHVPEVGALEEHERLLIRRLRARLTRTQLAKRLKISEFWLFKMENGTAPVERLREYWSAR